MDERMLSDRFHEALDVEPRAGAYDRLRTALAKSTVKPQQRAAFPIKWSRMGLRLAAVLTLVVLAIAAVAAFLATHRVADRIAPAEWSTEACDFHRPRKPQAGGCTACQDLSGPNQISCAGSQAANCEDLIATTARQVKNFQSAVVVIAAPSSLTAKDNRLQLDLGQAENALKAMVDALAAGDQSRFDAGRNSLRLAMPAVNRDAADIVGS